MSKEGIKVFIGYVLICLIWGSTWMVIRIGLETLTPFISAGIRFLAASLIIFTILKIKRIRINTDRISVRLYLMMGFLSFVIPFGLIYWAEQYIPSGLTSVIFGVYPFFAAIFSYVMLESEKITISKILGTILGFVGIIVIFSENLSFDFNRHFAAMLAVFTSGMLQAGIAVMIKKYGHELNPLAMNFYPMLICGTSLFVLGLIFENTESLSFNFAAVSSILFLAVFGSVITFTVYYWLLKRTSVILLALTAFITPVVAVIMGFIFLHEQLTERHLAGSILVLCGILFANLGNAIFINLKSRFQVKQYN